MKKKATKKKVTRSLVKKYERGVQALLEKEASFDWKGAPPSGALIMYFRLASSGCVLTSYTYKGLFSPTSLAAELAEVCASLHEESGHPSYEVLRKAVASVAARFVRGKEAASELLALEVIPDAKPTDPLDWKELGTQITTIFNAHWSDRPSGPITLGDLAAMTEYELRRRRGFGNVALRTVEYYLARRGFVLATDEVLRKAVAEVAERFVDENRARDRTPYER